MGVLDSWLDHLLAPLQSVTLTKKMVLLFKQVLHPLVQGEPAYRRRVCDHVFHAIEKVFRPNTSVESMRQEPNLLKKLKKVDDVWKSRNRVMGWIIGTLSLNISIYTSWMPTVQTDLVVILPNQCRNSHQKWLRLRSIAPALLGVGGCLPNYRWCSQIYKAACTYLQQYMPICKTGFTFWRP